MVRPLHIGTGLNERKRLPYSTCLAFLFLLALGGTVFAENPSPATTTMTTTRTVSETPSPDRVGGSIYFETFPAGALIWLDNQEVGTSPFTVYTEKPGIREVHAWKKGYENYTGQVLVKEGTRVIFSAVLTELPRGTIATPTFTVPVTTVTTIRKSTLAIPTTWPTAPESPLDSAGVIAAAAIGMGFLVIRRH